MATHEEELASLRAKHAKELEAAERNFRMKVAVMEALQLDAKAFRAGFMHAYGADCHIELHAETLPDAILIAERMGPITLCRVKDSSLSFLPDKRIPAKRSERAEIEPICPYIYEIDGVEGYAEEKRLRFFVEAAGYVVDVRVVVANDPDTARHLDDVRDNRGRLIERKRRITNNSGHFPRVTKWWAEPGKQGKYTLWSY